MTDCMLSHVCRPCVQARLLFAMVMAEGIQGKVEWTTVGFDDGASLPTILHVKCSAPMFLAFVHMLISHYMLHV